MTELREDEMEALLGFDKAVLEVMHYDDLVSRGGDLPYVAVIATVDGRRFMGSGAARIDAIHAAWETYQRFMATPREDRYNGYWMYENALANVEVKLWENLNTEGSES